MSERRWAIEEWVWPESTWRVIGDDGRTFDEKQMLSYLNSHFSVTLEGGQYPWVVKSVTDGEIILDSLSADKSHVFRHRFIRR